MVRMNKGARPRSFPKTEAEIQHRMRIMKKSQKRQKISTYASIIIGILGFGGIALAYGLLNADISLLNYFTIIGLYCLNLLMVSFILNRWNLK